VPDGSLTALAGLAAVDEVTGRLGMVTELDRGIGPIKRRDRGLTGGELLMGMAAAQLVGQDCLAGLDRVRADAGSALLAEAAVAPSTTASRLAGRFGPVQLAGIETAVACIYQRWLALTADFGLNWIRNVGTAYRRRTKAKSGIKADASAFIGYELCCRPDSSVWQRVYGGIVGTPPGGRPSRSRGCRSYVVRDKPPIASLNHEKC
jgi:hypothetical protein